MEDPKWIRKGNIIAKQKCIIWNSLDGSLSTGVVTVLMGMEIISYTMVQFNTRVLLMLNTIKEDPNFPNRDKLLADYKFFGFD